MSLGLSYPADPSTGLPGNTIGLRVTDEFGLTHTDNTTITIYDNRPFAALNVNPNIVTCGQAVYFDAYNSYHGHPGHTIVSYEWDTNYDGNNFIVRGSGAEGSVSYGPLGTYVIALRVTDDNSPAKTDFATLSVTLEDDINPYVSCISTTVHLDDNGAASIQPSDVMSYSSDNCGIVSWQVTPNTFDCEDVDDNAILDGTSARAILGVPVTLTVKDASGNSYSCMSNVIVKDEVDPFVSCVSTTVQLDENGVGSIEASDVTSYSSDNCGIVSWQVEPNTFDCSHVGTQSLIMTVTDNNDNSASCEALVLVERNNSMNCNWIGVVDKDWFEGGNWNNGCVPQSQDDVIILASAPNQPRLMAGSSTIRSLIIETNASLLVDGILNAIITNGSGNSMTNDGTVIVNGSFHFGGGNFVNNGIIMGTGEILEAVD
jgi:hypothetical protein